MSYKEKIASKVKAIAAKGKDVNAKIVETVKEDFAETVQDCKSSGVSLKHATYQTLEGIEEGLKGTSYKAEDILKKSSEAMVSATESAAKKSIETTHELAQKSKDELNHALEKTHQKMDDVNSSVKEKMTKEYTAYHSKVESEKEHLAEIGEGLKEYSTEKGHHLLAVSADKAKDTANHLESSFKEHSKKLLAHSESKVTSWFDSLSAKLNS